MMKLTAAAALATLTLATSSPAALAAVASGALADAYLGLSGFTLLAGNGAAGRSATALPIGSGVKLGPTATRASTLASLNGLAKSSSIAAGPNEAFAIESAVGAGFVAGSILPPGALSPISYAGSAAESAGNALSPSAAAVSACGSQRIGACVFVHNQTNLAAAGDVGSTQGVQTLLSSFDVEVSGAPQRFEMRFDAEGFLRAAVGQAGGSANASYSWTASVRAANGTTLLRWSPDGDVGTLQGSCRSAGTCAEYADAFSLSDNVGLLAAGDIVQEGFGAFEAEISLAAGRYTFTISHTTIADASAVPLPGALWLFASAGAGLLGVVRATRAGRAPAVGRPQGRRQ